jgi:glycosyltransferase involved in cell wall biosynthesis
MQIKNKFLFNFAVTHYGAGLKRLHAFARWFNESGGAWFIVHPNCAALAKEFPGNRFFLATQPRYQRIFNDCQYLDDIGRSIGQPDFYYSYGIPIYSRFGKLNWFHLCNILPLGTRGIPLSLFERVKLNFLGWRIRQNFENADIISAESNTSLKLIDSKQTGKLFLSVNGGDDELSCLKNVGPQNKANIATVVGTYKHKALNDSYSVFEMLSKNNSELKLMIIGDERPIPESLRRNKNVIIRGVLQRSEVIGLLQKSKYYISTTRIENSYNAASEGVFSADESYISDIGAHRELLDNIPFECVSIDNMIRPVLHVKGQDISEAALKTWGNIISEMLDHIFLKGGGNKNDWL